MSKLTILFLGFVTLFGGLADGQTQSSWKEYANPALGVSLRYPPDTLEPAVTVWPRANQRWANGYVDLVTRKIDPERPGLGRVTALRIYISHIDPPSQPVPMSFWQKQKGYREMKVGGRLAAKAISCGRAACSWGIHVSGSTEMSIFTLDPDESGKTGPDDARYPLRAIIDSIKFDPAFPKSTRPAGA